MTQAREVRAATPVYPVHELLADPQHPGWGNPPWPEKIVEFRAEQKIAIIRLVAAFDSGAPVVLLDAPVGSGKTVVAEAVRRIVRPGRTTHLSQDHALQTQFASDFPYCRDLRGRDNYPTLNFPDAFDKPVRDPERVTCGDCDFERGICTFCTHPDAEWDDDADSREVCPYNIALNRAADAALSSTNVSYFLNETNHKGVASRLRDRGLVVLDEADTAEKSLWGFEEISISPNLQRLLNLPPPDLKTVAEAWRPWFYEQAIPAVRRRRDGLSGQSLSVRRERQRLTRLLDRLEDVAPEVSEGRWVYDYPEGFIKFKPIRVDTIAPRLLWEHANRWLCMSATLLGRDVFCGPLGWEEYAPYVQMPSSFPPERRPIYVVPIADMSRKNRQAAWPVMAMALGRLIAEHEGERIIVHTVSGALAKFLKDNVSSPRCMSYPTGVRGAREKALREFRQRPGAVLIAPSMARGVDLPYDDCRVAVIAQLAYPNLGDKQVEARRFRTPDGLLWYNIEAIRMLAQQVGRHHRAADDESVTYILDSRFTSMKRQYERYFPLSFSDALITTGDHARRWLRSG